jgi:hypothetical protein
MSTAGVFLDIEKPLTFGGTLAKIQNLGKGEMSTPRYMKAGMLQGSVLSPKLYNLYINDIPKTSGVNLALFANDTCLYATELKDSYVLRKIERGLNYMTAWCEC